MWIMEKNSSFVFFYLKTNLEKIFFLSLYLLMKSFFISISIICSIIMVVIINKSDLVVQVISFLLLVSFTTTDVSVKRYKNWWNSEKMIGNWVGSNMRFGWFKRSGTKKNWVIHHQGSPWLRGHRHLTEN